MNKSQYWQGVGISSGVAVGKTWVLSGGQHKIVEDSDVHFDADKEILRLKEAVSHVNKNVEELIAKAESEQNEKAEGIFSAHREMLMDEVFPEEACHQLRQRCDLSAEKAINEVAQELITNFEAIDDDYLRERAADIRDLLAQILDALTYGGDATSSFPSDGEYIVIADELTPSQTVRLPKDRVKGFLLRKGGKTSHAAILAKTYGIASVVVSNARWEDLESLEVVHLDGDTGKVESITLDELATYEQSNDCQNDDYRSIISTKYAHITLAANIGNSDDLNLINKFKAHGVGLYRTEFLFMGAKLPSEDEQVSAYSKVIAGCAPHLTIIRTLDIGGDKQAPALNLPKEQNPFLGVRALRLCFQEPEMFLTQLRALWRASTAGALAVMFPMIATLAELCKAKEYLHKAKDDVLAAGHKTGKLQVGMMIEIPAAVVLAEKFAKEVDFFSIGTNDLIQYTMAADRENGNLAYLSQAYHPAVLNLIAHVAKAGTDADIWTGICGEAGGDPLLTPFFAAIGINELSMSPGQIPLVSRKLSELNMTDAESKQFVDKILDSASPEEVCAILAK